MLIGVVTRQDCEGSGPGRSRTPAPSHHDDDAGGHARPLAGSHFPRYWFRFTTAFRHRHGGRTHIRVADQRIPPADVVFLPGTSGRPATSSGSAFHGGRGTCRLKTGSPDLLP